MNIDSVLNVICSKAVDSGKNPIDCNLLDELLSTVTIARQDAVRNEPDQAKQIKLKSNMPVLLPSGRFEGSKAAKDLKQHTGLIVIDIDEKDNLHIKNFYELKQQFIKIPNVAYCGLSVRGKGYFLIIPIAHPDKHELHFDWLKLFFAAKTLNIDKSCRNVNRLRYCSHDPAAYYNHVAKPLQAYYVPPIVKPINVPQKHFKGVGVPVWEQYNEEVFFIDVLQKHGWQIESKAGQKINFTRPGKATGISAEYDYSKNVFFVFTSSTEFEPSKGYNPFAVYAVLDHAGDYSKAAKALILPANHKTITQHYKAATPPVLKTIAAAEPITPPKVIEPINEAALLPQGIYKLNIEQIKAIPYCKSINGIVVATLSMFDGKQYDTLCHNNTDQDFIIYGSLQNEVVAIEKELNVNFIPIDIGTGLIYGRETSRQPPPEPLQATTMLSMFVAMAKKHYQRTAGKVQKEKYFLAYSDSMATTLQQYGITQTTFLNHLN